MRTARSPTARSDERRNASLYQDKKRGLEGSIRKAGNRVRVTAQLIDGSTGGHLWAERYDRDLTDIFDVQDDVTRQIVGALKVIEWRRSGVLWSRSHLL